jgi:hypothetical protein
MESDQQESSFVEELSEDDGDWEEVTVPLAPSTDEVASTALVYEPYADLNPEHPTTAASNANIEITIQTKKDDGGSKCVRGPNLVFV